MLIEEGLLLLPGGSFHTLVNLGIQPYVVCELLHWAFPKAFNAPLSL